MNLYQEQQRKSLRTGNIVVKAKDRALVHVFVGNEAHTAIPLHRDLTARLMGDPVPGRSALDRRNETRQQP